MLLELARSSSARPSVTVQKARMPSHISKPLVQRTKGAAQVPETPRVCSVGKLMQRGSLVVFKGGEGEGRD